MQFPRCRATYSHFHTCGSNSTWLLLALEGRVRDWLYVTRQRGALLIEAPNLLALSGLLLPLNVMVNRLRGVLVTITLSHHVVV
mmetsp:Transcript_13460/g.38835  ORF Transcript_13460/g.38835 Transcript_13460/m.38835 type:complete len:84 (-) Transcript_13460:862-1113(-)